MGLLYIVLFFWTLLIGGGGLLASCMEGSHQISGTFLPTMLIGFGPLALAMFIGRRKQGKKQGNDADARMKLLAAAGVAAGTGCDHAEDGAGVAINRAARTLTLMAGGQVKTYAYADIREWEAKLFKAGRNFGVGVRGRLAAMDANAAARHEAASSSGLFVTVKDIDNPKWRVAMSDETMQARWMEILRQEIKGI